MMKSYAVGLNALGTRPGPPPRRSILGTVFGAVTIPAAGQVYKDRDTVLAVQKALLDSGYDVGKAGADGKWGPSTATAIRQMQAAHNMPQTGEIDYGVLAALNVPAPSSSKTRTEVNADDIKKAHDATAAADDATTPAEVQAASAQLQSAATNAPPEVKKAVQAAAQKAATAKTPADVAVAKEEVKAAAAQVTASGGFFNTNVPVINRPLWQVLTGVAVIGTGATLATLAIRAMTSRSTVSR